MSVSATYAINGMSCGHCVHAVTQELSRLDGVTAVSVDLHAGGTSHCHVLARLKHRMRFHAAKRALRKHHKRSSHWSPRIRSFGPLCATSTLQHRRSQWLMQTFTCGCTTVVA